MSAASSPTAITNGLEAMIDFLNDFEPLILRKNVKSDSDTKENSVIAAKSSLPYVPKFYRLLEHNPLLLIMTLFLKDKAICSNIMRASMSMGRDQTSVKFWRIIIDYSEGLRLTSKDPNEEMISKGLKAYSKRFSELTLDTVKTISLDSPCKETDVSKIRIAWLKLGDDFLYPGSYHNGMAVAITRANEGSIVNFIVEGAPFMKLQDGLRTCVLPSTAYIEGVGLESPGCDYQPDPIQSRAVDKEDSDDSNFDNDDYIIRPDAHFRHVENLEKSVLEGSYFFQCRGDYNRILTFAEIFSEKTPHCALEIRQYYHLIARSSRERWVPQLRFGGFICKDIERCRTALGSLLEDYFILCRVLDNFDFLSEAHFCSSYYTIMD